MPTYSFVNESGSTEELYFPMSECPPIGTTVEHDGRTLRRIIDTPSGFSRRDVNFASHQFEPYAEKGAKAFDKHGQPVFASRSDVREFVAQRNDTHPTEEIHYDEL